METSVLNNYRSMPDSKNSADLSVQEIAPDPRPYIVGIGTSAGGLEALQLLFDNIPQSSQIAYVIVQHLAPDYKSLMVELLSKHTHMKIRQIDDGMQVQPNSVYVMPPKTNLIINKGRLYLKQKDPLLNINFPIDIFFHSLGEDQGERAVGVVLSGTGTDGTRGIKTIKEYGGIVIVQEPNSAKFNGMPLSAISTQLVDFVLTPPQIASQLSETIQKSMLQRNLTIAQEPFEAEIFRRIINLIKDKTGIDFILYKRTTIYRRIARRMKINGMESMESYYADLLENKKEVHTLQQDLLIGVTQFFRDPEAFEIIEKKVIPEIFKNKSERETIRIWTPGCSTGEEAYSILILLEDYKARHKLTHPIKIFATDIDVKALEIAGNGVYPVNISADVKKSYLYEYFTQKDQSYHISQNLRNQVVFARHNIFSDPPFNRVDMIVCRNLMIYLESTLQDKIMTIFRFAINKGGFLFLGPSESVGDIAEIMEPVSKRWKIYQHTSEPQTVMPDLLSGHSPSFLNITPASLHNPLGNPTKKRFQPHWIDQFKDTLVELYSPKCVFINEDFDVLYLAGGVSKYVRLPEKALTLNFLKMVHKDLVIPLSTAIRKASKTNDPVRYNNIQFKYNDSDHFVCDLNVIPLPQLNRIEKILLISFIEHDGTVEREDTDLFEINDAVKDRINYLEQQLKDTRENLQATIEELETSNEELQASNEELMAANEELQSTNEELQSVNEELHSVNAEFQEKILHLSELSSDMDNMMSASEIGTIFLDSDMRIRKFTPAIQEYFNLMPQDIGRPISHFNTDLGIKDILKKAEEVLTKGIRFNEDITIKDKGHYFMRILPYKTSERVIKGIVITFVNIEGLKAT
ncbi:MAG: chemotaxis protein CheB [Bacteroidia bacterium]